MCVEAGPGSESGAESAPVEDVSYEMDGPGGLTFDGRYEGVGGPG